MNSKELQDCIEAGEKGVYLDLNVSPGSSRTKITGINKWRNQLELSIKEKAVRGEANKALLKLFAELLNISKKSVKLVRGKTTKSKRMYFEGVDKTELADRIKNIYEEN